MVGQVFAYKVESRVHDQNGNKGKEQKLSPGKMQHTWEVKNTPEAENHSIVEFKLKRASKLYETLAAISCKQRH